MADIRFLQWSDLHGDLGKYRAVVHFADRRKVDAGFDTGDMVQSQRIVENILKEILGDGYSQYKMDSKLSQDGQKLLMSGQISNEEFQKKYGQAFQRAKKAEQQAKQKAIQTLLDKYRSIDEIFGETATPKYFVPGNHDFFGFLKTNEESVTPLMRNATCLFSTEEQPIFDICGLKVFARTNTNQLAGQPEELCPHLDPRVIDINQLEAKLKDIRDPAEREARTREYVEADETYKLGKDLDFDIFLAHGQVGETLTNRSKTKDRAVWPYPIGALHLAREKKVPYLAGHTHNGIRSNRDGFPGFITDPNTVFEHVFDSETKKLKEVIVYEIKQIQKAA